MHSIVQKTNKLSGTILVPGSKSHTIRGLVFALLAKGKSVLINPLASDDTSTAIEVLKSLGAKIQTKNNRMIITGMGLPIKARAKKINTGDSGITTRFILPVLGLRENFNEPVIVDCGPQMRARPIASLVEALNKLGMNIRYLKKTGQLPLSVSGKLRGGKVNVNGVTSQYLSALLMSLPLAEKDSIISVKNLHERPYAQMTLKSLDSFAIKYSHSRFGKDDRFKIKGRQTYKYFKRQIPGDFSSASYLLASGALIGPSVVVKGLNMNDPQGDKRLVDILKKMGVGVKIKSSSIIINHSKNLRGIKIDANDIPDLVPTLAVLGTQAKGKTEITNVKQARIKETDRLHSMTQGLRAMGAKIVEKSDGMVVYNSRLKGAKVKGFGDHRTVMALSLAGMLAEGQTAISDAQAVDKTFPEFYKLMRELGAKIIIK